MRKKQSGTTLLELLIGVTMMLLLFGAVLGTLSQGFTAINMSRNKTHAQEANRIALEQTAALVRSSINPEPITVENNLFITRRNPTTGAPEDITVQKAANDSHLVATTTGGSSRTIGYNLNEIEFSSLTSGSDVGYVNITNKTGENQIFSTFSTSASPRVTHVTGETTAIITFSANTPIYNRTCRVGYTCGNLSISTLTLTPNQDMDSLRIIPQNGGIISEQLFGNTPADTPRTATFYGATNLPVNGTADSKKFVFIAKGKYDDTPVSSSPKVIAITVKDPCTSEPRSCDTGYAPAPDENSPYNPPCKICEKVYSCTDCGGDTHTSTISQSDADAQCNSYFCATTYDCKGDGHLCKRTSHIAAQICADALAVAVQCTQTFNYGILDIYNSMGLTYSQLVEDYGLPAAQMLRRSGQSNITYEYGTQFPCGEYGEYLCSDAFNLYDTSRLSKWHHAYNIDSKNKTEILTSLIGKDRYITKYYYIYNFSYGSLSPIILDLNGSGVPDVANGDWLPHPDRFDRNRAKQFDMTGEGYFMLTEWVGPQSGLLVTLDENSTVVSALNLFGTAGGWRDGYVKLAALFDKDRNNIIEGNELDGLYVWQDMNMNAKADPGELKTVKEWGITKIWTKHDHYRSLYERNGKELFTWDWWPSVIDINANDRNEMLKGKDLQKHQFINTNI